MKWFLLILSLLLSACAMLEGGKNNLAKPTPLVEFEPQVQVNRQWLVDSGVGVHRQYLHLTPVIKNGVVYTADAKGLVAAYSQSSGQLVWRTNTKRPISAGLAVADDMLIMATSEAQVLALSNQQEGEPIWRASVSSEVLATPVIVGNKVLIKTVDGKIFALDRASGEQLWVYDHGFSNLVLRLSSAPLVYGDSVIAGFADGKLDAIDIRNGELRWQRVVADPEGTTPVERMVDIIFYHATMESLDHAYHESLKLGIALV